MDYLKLTSFYDETSWNQSRLTKYHDLHQHLPDQSQSDYNFHHIRK